MRAAAAHRVQAAVLGLQSRQMNESGFLLRRPVAEACMHTLARQKIAQDGVLNLFLIANF